MWFWFAFPLWLMMLSIFSCVYWPFLYHPWRNVYLWFKQLLRTLVYWMKETKVFSERVYAQSLSRVQLFAAPRTVAHQDPLSMGFSRQEYWGGFICTIWTICELYMNYMCHLCVLYELAQYTKHPGLILYLTITLN